MISTLLIPIVLTAVIGTFIMTWFLREKGQLQLRCETHVLKAQQILVDGAYDLIALNPQVNNLINTRNQIRTQLLVALGPEKALFMARLIMVEAQMTALRMKQKLMIQTTQERARAELTLIDADSRSEANRVTRLWGDGNLHSTVHFSHPRMEVDPKYVDFTLPTYDFGIGYQVRQNLNADITIHGRSPFPLFVKEAIQESNMSWHEECASEPRQEGGTQWRGYLAAAKL